MAISAGYTCDIDRPLCTALKQHKGKTLFTRDRENIKPGRFHFGQNNFYDKCLSETPTKTAQTGLKTSRTDYVHIGTKSERGECYQISCHFDPDLSCCSLKLLQLSQGC